MKKSTALHLLLGAACAPTAFAVQHYRGPIHQAPPPPFAEDRVLVRFKPGSAASEIGAAHGQAGGHKLNEIPGIGVHVVQVPNGAVLDTIALYQANPNVEFAEPDYNRILVIPDEQSNNPASNDFGLDFFAEQWGLDNTGHLLTDPNSGALSLYGTPDADIDAPEGWDITTGNSGVVIAVLDTGIECSGNLELAGKCVDEQNFVSAYSISHGYPDSTADFIGHGTHIAGIAAANTNNDLGIAGVGWNSSIANLKTCYEYEYDMCPPWGCTNIVGVCPVSASAAAITYAADHNYPVINMSYGSDLLDPVTGDPVTFSSPPDTEAVAVAYAWGKGSVMVAAAGNNSNTQMVYPAALPEVIAVAASDRHDDRASFSTFGNTWVSLLAPGENIISVAPVDQCQFFSEILGTLYDPTTDACLTWYSGTSMASPHVAGAAALVWADLFAAQLASPLDICTDGNGTPCNEVVRSRLENGADTVGALGQNFGAWVQHGRLNVAGALDNPPAPLALPSEPTNLNVVDNTDGTATLSWTDENDSLLGYNLERQKQRKSGNWSGSTLLSLFPDSSPYTDESGTGTFRYRAQAVNQAGISTWTDWSETTVSDTSGGGGGGKNGGKGGKK